ncbi:MAG TPA: hypothetical protein PLN21_00955 [Gemmatales bacterium]|nr:hypothetical protein [Gemmatales bacterium]
METSQQIAPTPRRNDIASLFTILATIAILVGFRIGLESTIGYWGAFITGIVLASMALAIGTSILGQQLKCQWRTTLGLGITLLLMIATWDGVKEFLKPRLDYSSASLISLVSGVLVGWLARFATTSILQLRDKVGQGAKLK